MTKEDREKKRSFSLNEPQINVIFSALEDYVTDRIVDAIEDVEIELRKGNLSKDNRVELEDQLKFWNEQHDIAVPLWEYFKEFYFLIKGMPEVEPVLKCEPLLESALKNWDEQIEYQKRIHKLWEYKRKQK